MIVVDDRGGDENGWSCAMIRCLAERPELCDVTFVLQGGEELHGIRGVLAAHSEPLRSMLFGGMREARERRVRLPHARAAAFAPVMEYIHSGRCVVPCTRGGDCSTALEVMQLADHFQVLGLKHALCDAFLPSSSSIGNNEKSNGFIHTGNAANVLECASRLRVETLFRSCVEFVALNIVEMLTAPEDTLAGELSEATLCDLLSSNDLAAPEAELFSVVVRWGHRRMRDSGVTDGISSEVLREVVARPLRHIRFPLISAGDLVEIVQPTCLVASAVVIEALAFQADEGSVTAARYEARFQPRRGAVDYVSERAQASSDFSSPYFPLPTPRPSHRGLSGLLDAQSRSSSGGGAGSVAVMGGGRGPQFAPPRHEHTTPGNGGTDDDGGDWLGGGGSGSGSGSGSRTTDRWFERRVQQLQRAAAAGDGETTPTGSTGRCPLRRPAPASSGATGVSGGSGVDGGSYPSSAWFARQFGAYDTPSTRDREGAVQGGAVGGGVGGGQQPRAVASNRVRAARDLLEVVGRSNTRSALSQLELLQREQRECISRSCNEEAATT